MIYTDKDVKRIEDIISILSDIVNDNEKKIEFLESRNVDLNLEISCLRRCLNEQSCV